MIRIAVLALFAFAFQAPTPKRAAPVTAIRAGAVVDPETGAVTKRQVILVEGERIQAIGGDVAVPDGANVIDLGEAFVLPGLFDCHTHLCMSVKPQRDRGNYYYTTLNDSTAARAIEGVANARAMLEAGFTSVRDVGNAGNYADVELSRAIFRRVVPGPTMLVAGRIIAPFGGQFHLQPEKRGLAEPEYFFADTRDEMVKAIHENAHFGAHLIKIVVDDQRYIYSADDIAFIVAEAKRAGMRVAAHAWTHAGAHNAATAGVSSIEHGFEMTDEDLQLAKKNGVVLCGTDMPAIVDPARHAQWVDRLRRAAKAGVTMAFGTDAIDLKEGYTRGTLAMTWIDTWVEAGVPPLTLLQAMTANATRLLGLETQRGFLRPGFAADLIAVAENPLENVQTLKRVGFVMKDGRVVVAPAAPPTAAHSR